MRVREREIDRREVRFEGHAYIEAASARLGSFDLCGGDLG